VDNRGDETARVDVEILWRTWSVEVDDFLFEWEA
jgi:hypothetical protein